MADLMTVAAYLKLKGKATKLQAVRDLHEINLGDKIMKLRRKGWNIETVMVPRENRSAYALYMYRGDK